MNEIREMSIDDLFAHARVLLKAHHEESAGNQDLMTLNLDENRYRNLELAGHIIVLGAWLNNHLIGYSVNLISTHLHSAELVVCVNDLLFIDKAYRKGRTGLNLIRATETASKSRGARMILWGAKPNTRLNKLLTALKCCELETIYCMRI